MPSETSPLTPGRPPETEFPSSLSLSEHPAARTASATQTYFVNLFICRIFSFPSYSSCIAPEPRPSEPGIPPESGRPKTCSPQTGTFHPSQNLFPQGWRISVILKINALNPLQATRSGVVPGSLFSARLKNQLTVILSISLSFFIVSTLSPATQGYCTQPYGVQGIPLQRSRFVNPYITYNSFHRLFIHGRSFSYAMDISCIP